METIDLTQTLPAGTSSMLSAGGILMLSAIIVLVVVIMKRWKARVMPGILGVIAYAVFVFIFANLATSALALIPSIDNIFYNNPATYNIVYALFATAGFTAARVVTGYMLNERFERKGDVYLAGIGLSIGDSLLYGMTAISYITWCTAIQAGQAQDMLAIDQQFNVVGRLFVQGPVFQRFHVYIHSQARFARRSAIKVTRKKAPIRSKKPMAINRGLKPILSAVTPIIRENRKLAIHAAEPRMPLTVAI